MLEQLVISNVLKKMDRLEHYTINGLFSIHVFVPKAYLKVRIRAQHFIPV